MRGDELARVMRGLAPDLPIVMASGYDPAELKAKFADDGRVAVNFGTGVACDEANDPFGFGR